MVQVQSVDNYSCFYNCVLILRVGVENLYEVMKEEKIPADDKLIEQV